MEKQLDSLEHTKKELTAMPYALVTGCDHGLGPSIADLLAQRGYTVAACCLNPANRPADPLASRDPKQVRLYTVDIGRDESVHALYEDVSRTFPCLDLLVNCAGILGMMENSPEGPLDFDLMAQVINVNAIGTLRMTTAFLPLVEKSQQKTIVNISSEAGSIQDCWRKGWFGYCMSKAANNMQGALIHNFIRERGGRVIQMHPGHVATYMRGHLDTTASVTPEDSAKGIVHVVLDTPLPLMDRPLYLDYTGKELRY